MDLLNYSRVLQDFRYKPNFSCRAHERDSLRVSDTEWWVKIVMLVENSRAPFQPWALMPEMREPDFMDFYRDNRVFNNGAGRSPSRKVIEIEGNFRIPYFEEQDELLFVEWMVCKIREMEDHETFEWLRYKGELINDPHK
jgi:hypothetical protein